MAAAPALSSAAGSNAGSKAGKKRKAGAKLARGSREGFLYIADRLFQGLHERPWLKEDIAEEVSLQFVREAADVLAELMQSHPRQQRRLMDGLVDLRPPQQRESPDRTWRRKMHQGLQNLCRFLLDSSERLEALTRAATSDAQMAMRRFVTEAIAEKSRLRRLSRRFGQLHEEVLRSSRNPSAELAAAYRDAALENMRKRWNVAFHEWCAEAIAHYFLLDPEKRRRWVCGTSGGERSRETVLSASLRQGPKTPQRREQLAEEILPGPGARLRLLDMGSCANYFGRYHSDRFDVTALDLAPAEDTVLRCDVLDMEIGPSDTDPVVQNNRLKTLPAESFDVVLLALLLSYMTDPRDRALVIRKSRELLQKNRGVLIVADTVAAIGRPLPRALPRSLPEWVSSVEAAGFRLLRDPQMHFSALRDRRTGVVNRASCFSFAVQPLQHAPRKEAPPLLPLRLPQDSQAKPSQGGHRRPRRRTRRKSSPAKSSFR